MGKRLLILLALVLGAPVAGAGKRATRLKVKFEGPDGHAGHVSVAIGTKALLLHARTGKRRGQMSVPIGENLGTRFWFANTPHLEISQIPSSSHSPQVQLSKLTRVRRGRAHHLRLSADGSELRLDVLPTQTGDEVWLEDSIQLGLDAVPTELAHFAARNHRPPTALNRMTPLEQQLFAELVAPLGPVAVGDQMGWWNDAERDGAAVRVWRMPPQATERGPREATHGVSTSSNLLVRTRMATGRTLTLGAYAFTLELPAIEAPAAEAAH